MEYENVVNVKKRVSPLAYIGIILLVIALAFASMVAVLHFMKPAESYMEAEKNYFSSAASSLNLNQDLSAAVEYELNLGLNTASPLLQGYFDSLNNTVLKGFVGVDGSKINYALDYFNGNKKILSAAMWMNDNIISFAFPGISDIMLTAEIPGEYMYGDYSDFDYEAFEVTLNKITDKYFELVGEPEIIEEKTTVEYNGISKECVVYRVKIDTEFMRELLSASIDAILENESLVELCGGEEFADVLNEGRSEMDYIDDTDTYIRMDVYASDNVICKRVISVVDPNVDAEVVITNLDDKDKGYFSIVATSEENEAVLKNEYTKDGDKASGTITLSTSAVIYGLVSGDLFTITYKDTVYDELYGYIGEFKLSVPSAAVNLTGSSKIDDKYNFSFDVDFMGQQVCSLSGSLKYHDEYVDAGMPDKGQFEEHSISIDPENPSIDDEVLQKFEEDFMEFFGSGIYDSFADENGNYDVVGAIISSMFTSNFYFAGVNDFVGLY